MDEPAQKNQLKPTTQHSGPSRTDLQMVSQNREPNQAMPTQSGQTPTPLAPSAATPIAADGASGHNQTLVPATLLEDVQLGLGVSLTELATLLGRSKSTIQRYKQAKQPIHQPAIAQHLSQLQALIAHGSSLFGYN